VHNNKGKIEEDELSGETELSGSILLLIKSYYNYISCIACRKQFKGIGPFILHWLGQNHGNF
jgi:hypothetical protein